MGFTWSVRELRVLDDPNFIDQLGHYIHGQQSSGYRFAMDVMGYKAMYYSKEFEDLVKSESTISTLKTEVQQVCRGAFSKLGAESVVQMYKNSLIIRPSIVCGDEDNFINFFARYAKLSPFLPLIGKGETKFQPVLVTDVVEIIYRCLNVSFKKGQIIEIGGDDILSFKEILNFIVKELRVKRVFINMPFSLAKKLAFFLEKLPFSLLTRDQVEMLKTNNIMDQKKSFKKYFKYEPLSFFIFAKRQLENFKKDGGHIN